MTIVPRRLPAAIILCVSLLGLTAPALACSLLAMQGNCCTTSASCSTGGETVLAAPAVTSSCCVPSATAMVSSISEGLRAGSARAQADAPDPVVVDASVVVLPDHGRVFSCDGSTSLAASADAKITYLRTGRLRL